MELGARGGTDLEDVPLDRGILLVRLFPFPACPVCVSVSPRVRVCVYNNLSVCLREGRAGGEGAGASTRIPWVFICPAAEPLQAEDLGEQGAEGAGPAGVQSLNSCSLQCFQSLLLFQTQNCCLGTCCC